MCASAATPMRWRQDPKLFEMTGSLRRRILDDDRQFKTARLGEAGEQSRIKPNVGQFDVVVRSGGMRSMRSVSGWTTAGRPSIRTRTSESSCSEGSRPPPHGSPEPHSRGTQD